MRDLAGIAEINGPRRAELQVERAATVAAQRRPKLTEPAWFYAPSKAIRALDDAWNAGNRVTA